MGVKVEIGTMSSQSTSAKTVLDQQVLVCQQLVGRFNQFCGEGSLKGKGYESAKQYAQAVFIPLLNGMITYLQTLSEAVSGLHPKYSSEVGDESLDQDILEQQIASYRTVKQAQEAIMSLPGVDKIMSSQTKQSITGNIEVLSAQISAIQEKLNKLLAFNGSSGSVFAQLAELDQAIKEGLASIQLNKQFQGGSFTLPTDMRWKKKLESGDKVKLQRDIYKNMKDEYYGGNQGSPADIYMYGSEVEKKQLENIIKKYHPEIDSEEKIVDYLKKLNSEGCGYVALTNTLFSRYKGSEKSFEKNLDSQCILRKMEKKFLIITQPL